MLRATVAIVTETKNRKTANLSNFKVIDKVMHLSKLWNIKYYTNYLFDFQVIKIKTLVANQNPKNATMEPKIIFKTWFFSYFLNSIEVII